jgi:hypothetical protein
LGLASIRTNSMIFFTGFTVSVIQPQLLQDWALASIFLMKLSPATTAKYGPKARLAKAVPFGLHYPANGKFISGQVMSYHRYIGF